MAKIRLTSPTFDASAQTVTHSSFSDVGLSGIQLIVNVTDQTIIYNFADTSKGGTLAGDVLTLEFDTTSMADADELMVLVEDGVAYQLPTGAATSANQTTLIAAVDGLEALLGTIDADTGAILSAVDGIEALLTTIDADTGEISAHIGTLSDAASTVGGTGSLSAKLRLQTTQLDAIQTAVQTLDNAIAGSEMQVDVVGALPAGTNNIGDVDILSIAAGDNNIGNVDIVTMPGTGIEDAAETAGGTLLMAGTVRRDTAASSAGTTGDNATLNTDSLGRLWISGAAVEDAAETAGGILLMAGSVRRDTAASSAGTTGDNATINTDSVGALWTRDTATQVDDAAFTPATGRVMPIGFLADETATDSVDEGDGGIARMTLDRKQITTPYVHAAAGGSTPYYNLDVDESEDEIKGTAGKVFWIHAVNLSASKLYLKFYNATAANVTVGTTTPVLSLPVPTFATTNGAGFTINFGDAGVQFSTAITVACTTGFADNSTGAPGANELILNLGYA